MPSKKPGPIVAWSYSRLSTYEVCPRQAFYKYVEKREESPNAAMKRGLAAHGALETFVKAKRAPSLGEFARARPELTQLRRAGAIAELELAFDREWRRVAWFDRAVRVRIKIDLVVPMAADRRRLIDYKTGEPKPERHVDQLGLYGLGVFMAEPEVQTVEGGLWYVDHHAKPVMLTVTGRSQLPGLRDAWERRAGAMLGDRKFAPLPRPWACRRCHFSAKRGGPCEAAAA